MNGITDKKDEVKILLSNFASLCNNKTIFNYALNFLDVFIFMNEEEIKGIFNNVISSLDIDIMDINTIFEKEIVGYFLLKRPSDILIEIEMLDENKKIVDLCPWCKSLGYTLINNVKSLDQFRGLSDKTIVYDKSVRFIYFIFGIENMQMFDKETSFFSYNFESYITMLNEWFSKQNLSDIYNNYKSFNYQVFVRNFSKILSLLKKDRYFLKYPNYDFIDGEFRENYNSIFIDRAAPIQLKKLFYSNSVSPSLLMENKDWWKYLYDKDLSVTLGLDVVSDKLNEYFKVFGFKSGIKILSREESSIVKMINEDKDTLVFWFLKSGKKFVPNYRVMKVVPLNYVDRYYVNYLFLEVFLNNKEFSSEEGKNAIITLAIVFGVLDGDLEGIKKLESFLNGVIDGLDEEEIIKIELYEKKLSERLKKEILDVMEEEGLVISDESIINTFYKYNNGKYYKIKNYKKYPKSFEYLRKIIKNALSNVLSLELLIQIASNLSLNYYRDFRDFLVLNRNHIILDSKLRRCLCDIQVCFEDVKLLDLENIIKYVEDNDISNSSDNQLDIESTLVYSLEDNQDILNIMLESDQSVVEEYKTEVSNYENFNYDLLRLDDSVSIGKVSNYVSRLDLDYENFISKNNFRDGRVFVIKSQNGEIVKQSFLYLKGKEVCFDNIDVSSFSNYDLKIEEVDKIKEIYNLVRTKIVTVDSEEFLKYSVSGIVSGKNYKNIRISGDNRDNLLNPRKLDFQKPYLFESPVSLSHFLYVNDSKVRYVMDEENKVKESLLLEEAKALNSEMPSIYDYTTIDEVQALSYKKLKAINKEYIDFNTDDYVGYLSSLFKISRDSIKMVLNSNYAILFTNLGIVRIYDIVINTKVKTKNGVRDISTNVMKQLRIGLSLMVKSGEDLDIGNLSLEKQNIVMEALGITKGEGD